ncbi:hypothetical protein GRX03_15290 [Halovenus sp. WSH3]|uniref:DUF7344 domain-containing protein n=1 Tax=Halovenus carboxidivorans TaxID=2692199 RepID=A0A6B0TBF5_9EURY|nr:hypothetical protein [Halovenus carboxidivorans]MXR52963.1 hypothetical protein [Halovenus carboxidivorans]
MPQATDTHRTEDQPAGSEYQLSKAEVFELLSADRRQAVLLYLDTAEGTVQLGELAEHIASQECNCTPAELSSQQRKRAYVGLYQCHLPKMADAGVIDYDSDRGTIDLTERSDRLLEYLYFEEEGGSEEPSSVFERLLG